ncbi:amylosucrase [Cellulomonas marina]|uniref:Amylosucrase n=1 Tax=Cellulomonas marina TaxID=988821 RepID=A0A1I0V3K0_9CELL|nr:alpha-amylase family protein [Cellulomonas marina]GIG28293.1 amylosucrase [Cellulomonas marina]SFA70637.1 amylosucrase [Cellulomonas marina]
MSATTPATGAGPDLPDVQPDVLPAPLVAAAAAARRAGTSDEVWAAFEARVARELPRLVDLFHHVYGEGPRVDEELALLVGQLATSWQGRSEPLRTLDAQREADPEWFSSERALGGVLYVDRWAGSLAALRERIGYLRELGLTYLHLMPLFAAPEGNSDGGYAVSSYRDVDPRIGTMDELAALAAELRENGIALVVDFIFNHTSDEHVWAQRALAGDPEHRDFYWVFPDRTMPDAYERTVREIFPDNHPGSFVPFPDGPPGPDGRPTSTGSWVWATFHDFQWDLNYGNPAVFRAMAGEMLFLANQGVDVLRMDAVAFIWKRLGTSCESLPEAHLLLQAFNAVCRIAAPAVVFKSEAIVHPDEVIGYISPGECQISYNPLQMALIWSSLATRDGRLLAQALERRHALPPGTAWVNYVRSHDDIGWTFADEDAAELGIDAAAHRRFLNAFFVDRFPGSFARGVPFQDNPRTGDCRISGTTASLAGLEAGDAGAVDRILLAHAVVLSTGGLPLLFLGDEVGQLNDYAALEEPGHAEDSRWVNRPRYPAQRYAEREDPTTDAGRVFAGLRLLLETRRRTPELAGNRLVPFDAHDPALVAYQRPGWDERGATTVLVVVNVADEPRAVAPTTLSGLPDDAEDLLDGGTRSLARGLTLPAHGVVWLRLAHDCLG